jgi:hypothetical protein
MKMNTTPKMLLVVFAVVAGFYLLRGPLERSAVERVAAVEHEQWMSWSKAVAPEVSPERRAGWEKLWVPYSELPEEEKEKDREWARKTLAEAYRSE